MNKVVFWETNFAQFFTKSNPLGRPAVGKRRPLARGREEEGAQVSV